MRDGAGVVLQRGVTEDEGGGWKAGGSIRNSGRGNGSSKWREEEAWDEVRS